MFASNNAEVLKFQKITETPDVLKTILSVYKKLKDIAKDEFNPKLKYKVAELSGSQLQKVKDFENNLNCCLVVYSADRALELENEKLNILNKINQLLNQYSALGDLSKTKT